MSPSLPVVSAQETIKALKKIGSAIVRQKGSHIRLRNSQDRSRQPITVPNHREVKSGLLRSILNDAKLTVEEFLRLLLPSFSYDFPQHS